MNEGFQEPDASEAMRRMSRRSFLWGAAAVAGAAGGWSWLQSCPREDGIPWPFRRALETNERVSKAVLGEQGLAPTFPASRAVAPRLNGRIGLADDFDPRSWRLALFGLRGPADAERPDLSLTLEEITALPRVDLVTELKCVEGWSQVVHWTGASFSSLLERYVGQDLPPYVALETPDRQYYVGLDRSSVVHPQTLLAYEVGGQPLTAPHGAPLRLVIPLKYGIKHLKRIGNIRLGRERPRDYWAERGYDWYAGL